MVSQNVPPPERPPIEDKLAAFDSVPLFMKSLPAEDTDDAVIGALQSLAYEGTPDEIAQNFKTQGNDYFKGKRYREALGFYTQGVDAKPSDIALQEALLCNRAACNLELKNFGFVLRDCSRALTLNSLSTKAYYRSALALLALERVNEALDCCDRCLAFDTDNKSVHDVRERALNAKAKKEQKEKEQMEKVQREMRAKRRLDAAFKERNLATVVNPDGASENPYAPHFDPDDPTQSTLIIPVFFLYPQHATSDIISHFVEDTPFAAHLSAMFPPKAQAPEWDHKGEYVDGQLVIYAMTRQKKLLRVGKNMTLRDVCNAVRGKGSQLTTDVLEVKGGCLTFVVLPANPGETVSEEVQPQVQERKIVSGVWPFLVKHPVKSQTVRVDHRQKRHSRRRQAWACNFTMSVNHKILRTANAPTTSPDETETSVAQALIDLENNVPELKAELRPLQISAAREVDVRGGKKAIVVFVPVPQLKAFRKVQQRLTRELEKKFSDRHVVFVAQRRMLRKPTRTSRVKQKRPRSRTLTNVHERILEDLVFPTEIVGKRTRVAVDGSKLLKVFLDSKDATSLEYKLDSFSSVYRRLTGKDVVFEFPVVAQE